MIPLRDTVRSRSYPVTNWLLIGANLLVYLVEMAQGERLGAFIVTPSVIVQGIGLSLAVGLLAGLAPAYGAARRPVVDTLRDVF